MDFNMAQVQGMTAQMLKIAAKMWKTTTQMQKSMAQMQKTMAQMHTKNNINYARAAQYLQAVSGVFNAMAQYESQMSQFYSGQTRL